MASSNLIDSRQLKTRGPKGVASLTLRRKQMLAAETQVMKEEVSDWLSATLRIKIEHETILESLADGIVLGKLALRIDPKVPVSCREKVAAGSFFARDNIQQFIGACEKLGVPKITLFESDDLMSQRNPRLVMGCILYLSKIAIKYGITPPDIVRFEMEIDAKRKADATHSDYGTAVPAQDYDPEKFKSFPNDPIDAAVAYAIKQVNFRQRVERVDCGEYFVGPVNIKKYLRIIRGMLLVRTDDGWERFESFLSRDHGRGLVQPDDVITAQPVLASPSKPEQSQWLDLIHEGDDFYSMGSYRRALEKYDDAKLEAKRAGNMDGTIEAYGCLAKLFQTLGLYRLALDACRKYLNLCEEIGVKDEGVETSAKHMSQYMHDHEASVLHLEELMQVHRSRRNVYAQASVNQALANSLAALTRTKEALDKFHIALTMYEMLECPIEVQQVFHGIANIYKDIGEVDKALEYYQMSARSQRESTLKT